MTSKHLLVDTSRNQLARDLLRSADLDEPPAHSVARLAVALGLGSSAVVSTLASGAAASTQATVGAAVTTAKGLTLAGAVPATGSGVAANLTTGAVVVTNSAGAANAVASAGMLSGVAAASATTTALPVVTSSLSAVGMLKAMAVVSLTCGALSFGGTKLAMTIAESAKPAATSVRPEHTPAPPVHRERTHTLPSTRGLEHAAVPDPIPAELEAADEVLPPPGLEIRLVDVPGELARNVAPERNVGRADTNRNDTSSPVSVVEQSPASLATAELSDVTATGGVREPAVAAFPSEEEPSAPALQSKGARKPKQRAKQQEVQSEEELERELLLIERARNSVAAGQPLVALQALDAYRSQARRGTLRAESLVLRVRALLALGQRTAAERHAVPFIQTNPESQHAARLRELLGIPSGPR